jgi:hypothetical protein
MSGRRTRGAKPSAQLRLRSFAFAGHVTVWDSMHRHLEIGSRGFGVARTASVAGLAPGVHVTVTGYVERPPDSVSRWVVTRLVFG